MNLVWTRDSTATSFTQLACSFTPKLAPFCQMFAPKCSQIAKLAFLISVQARCSGLLKSTFINNNGQTNGKNYEPGAHGLEPSLCLLEQINILIIFFFIVASGGKAKALLLAHSQLICFEISRGQPGRREGRKHICLIIGLFSMLSDFLLTCHLSISGWPAPAALCRT